MMMKMVLMVLTMIIPRHTGTEDDDVDDVDGIDHDHTSSHRH